MFCAKCKRRYAQRGNMVHWSKMRCRQCQTTRREWFNLVTL